MISFSATYKGLHYSTACSNCQPSHHQKSPPSSAPRECNELLLPSPYRDSAGRRRSRPLRPSARIATERRRAQPSTSFSRLASQRPDWLAGLRGVVFGVTGLGCVKTPLSRSSKAGIRGAAAGSLGATCFQLLPLCARSVGKLRGVLGGYRLHPSQL